MTMHYVIGDATEPVQRPAVIAHVCNDAGGWGRGFVLALSNRWPMVEAHYRWWAGHREHFELGEVQIVPVGSGLWVANMIAQRGTRPHLGQPPVRYEAITAALAKVNGIAAGYEASVHMPRIGCGLAGGTWDIVGPIVEKELVDVDVYIYDLPKEAA